MEGGQERSREKRQWSGRGENTRQQCSVEIFVYPGRREHGCVIIYHIIVSSWSSIVASHNIISYRPVATAASD